MARGNRASRRQSAAVTGRSAGQGQAANDNLARLSPSILNAGTVAQFIGQRHSQQEQPFTDCGTTALVVANPGRDLSVMHDASAKVYARRYKDVAKSADDAPLPPHIFDLASKTYIHLRRLGQDQAVILTGISGSGKSETHRALVRQLCLLAAHSKKDAKMHAQVQQAQTVLEGFGCTRTITNPNASRYSLFEELQFNERGRVVGAKLLAFGLEKSRLISAGPRERTFHAFHYLLAGASTEERQRWQLQDPNNYAYLRGRMLQIPGVDDALRFQELVDAMRICGIKSSARAQVFQLLSAILQLGELEFAEGELADDACVIVNHPKLETVAGLLGVTTAALETALTQQTRQVRNDICTVLLNPDVARAHRDNFACTLYSLLFAWLVECLNQKLCREEETVNIIALLDPQGFRLPSTLLPSSGTQDGAGNFETFLANFSAEQVHAFASRRVFEGPVDKEMRQDGLQVPRVLGGDPYACVQLLRGSSDQPAGSKKKNNVLEILDSEAAKTGAQRTEAQLTSKLKRNLGDHRLFAAPPTGHGWTITHFAGPVTYADSLILEKHIDTLAPDLVQLCRRSTLPFIAELFSSIAVATESDPRNAQSLVAAKQQGGLMRAPSRRFKRIANRQRAGGPGDSSNVDAAGGPTSAGSSPDPAFDTPMQAGVARQLDQTLSELFASLEECRVWVAYHVQPNRQDIAAAAGGGAAPAWDVEYTERQAQAMQLAELARQRQTAPEMTVAFGHSDFLERFEPLMRTLQLGATRTPRDKVNAYSMLSQWADEDARIGERSVFISEPVWRRLEDALRSLEKEERAVRRDGASSVADQAAHSETTEPNSSHPSAAYPPSSVSAGAGAELPRVMPAYSVMDDGRSMMSEDEYFEMRNHGAFMAGMHGGSVAGSVAGDLHRERMHTYYGGGYAPGHPTDDADSASAYESVYHSGARGSEAGGHPRRPMWGHDSAGSGSDRVHSEPDGKGLVDGELDPDENEDEEEVEISRQRRCWVCCTMALTWWIPNCCISRFGRMKREDIQMAWREKVAICIIIFFFCLISVLYIVLLPSLLCPKMYMFSPEEVAYHQGTDDLFMSLHGLVYDVSTFARNGHGSVQRRATQDDMLQFAGMDVTPLFPLPLTETCPGLVFKSYVEVRDNRTILMNGFVHRSGNDPRVDITSTLHEEHWYKNHVLTALRRSQKGRIAFDPKRIADEARLSNRRWIILGQDVIDLTYYYDTLSDPAAAALNITEFTYLSKAIDPLFSEYNGQDNTERFENLRPASARQMIRNCMLNTFKVGVVDLRRSLRCLMAEYLLLTTACFLVAVILVKFLAALQLGTRRNPEDHDKFVICQVPCYTEGEDSLQRAFESLAMLDYDDKRKLIFVIADGMIVGSGNDRPTPRIVLDLLGVDPKYDTDPLPFKSVGEGANQLNYGKVYSGLYEHEGHVVPYLVVVKVGRPTESRRPGNRGKRDSQIVLMRFLNRVHFDRAMSPLELEVFHQLKNVIGVHPSFYEYILMVDADTQVSSQSLNRLISCMLHDQRVMGICGETRLANEDLTWATMIQVYEYYISHHMAKAFESLFGSVTCLPGCFCMYRVRTPVKNRPLIIADDVVSAYAEHHVDTLHKKNLLALGEDRYLTTLMLKHFPQYKMTFTPDATCETAAPEKWSILLSQRRRWINSTIHNLIELLFLQDLCGFCCFSMRFVVMIDLLGTVLMPASLVYIGYLLYLVIDAKNSGTAPGTSFVSLIILAAVYGLQAVIFILKRQWQHIGWMIIYLLAMPLFSFFIPIYSFWHFDDFSWGNTRVVVGENKKKKIITVGDEERFDPRKIPLRTWAQYEQEMQWEVGSAGSRESHGSAATGYTHQTYGSHAASSHRGGGGSQYGDGPAGYGSGARRAADAMSQTGPRTHYAGSVVMGPTVGGSEQRFSHAYSNSASTAQMATGMDAPCHMIGQPPMAMVTGPASAVDPRVSTYSAGYARSDYDPSGMPMAAHTMAGPSSIARPISAFSSTQMSFVYGAPPNDEQLVSAIRHILSTSDLMTITKKQVRDQLGALFGVDLMPRKDYINSTIERILQGRL